MLSTEETLEFLREAYQCENTCPVAILEKAYCCQHSTFDGYKKWVLISYIFYRTSGVLPTYALRQAQLKGILADPTLKRP